MTSFKDIKRPLTLSNSYVEQCSYERLSDDIIDRNLEIEFTKNIEHNDKDDSYKVVLTAGIQNEMREFRLTVTYVGIFKVESENELMREVLINSNAVAILFPFIRAQITLITTSPGIDPIILPIIDVNQLLEKE